MARNEIGVKTMNISEFKKFIESGEVERVVLFAPFVFTGYEVFVYGSDVLRGFGNALLGRAGQVRTYTSLDRARAFIRESGYTGVIEIDG